MAETLRPGAIDYLTLQVQKALQVNLDPSVVNLQRLRKEEVLELIQRASWNLPNSYRLAFSTPLLAWLQGDSYEAKTFWKFYQNPEEATVPSITDFVRAVCDVIQAALQIGGMSAQSLKKETDAFQEVVSDLYDGFLSEEDRAGIKPPDYEKLPALIKWGGKQESPYTLTADFCKELGIKCAVVNLPCGFAKTGVAGYTALGHETAGHDVLHADEGLLPEIKDKVLSAIKPDWLARYWARVSDEAASDILSVMNFGPSAAIGLIAVLRGFFNGRLRNSADFDNDVHPIDILRGFMQLEVLNLLPADSGKKWAAYVLDEVNKDLKAVKYQIIFPGRRVINYDHMHPSSNDAKAVQQSIKDFAKLITATKLYSLEQHSLGEIQTWSNEDERQVEILRQQIKEENFFVEDGFYAAHAVAAALMETMETQDEIIFLRMIKLLDAMHEKNPLYAPPRFRCFSSFAKQEEGKHC